ncbi:TPA: uracil-DNA glycosylase family protein [Streptococcus agalactiae]|nr:uracil-DNA glycosylase family protein [Streptococcus agalactiae]
MTDLEKIIKAIKSDSQNQNYTENGIDPLFAAPKTARINIVGQAPGLKTQEARLYWKDKSGDRLRQWLGVDEETFYHSGKFAVLPLDFYYLGKGKSGDLPPRKGFAEKWHPLILKEMPNVQLTLLVGQYAQKYYLGSSAHKNLTETVKAYKDYLPDYLPLVHPSPRNQIWLKKNPWFEKDLIVDLQKIVADILKD